MCLVPGERIQPSSIERLLRTKPLDLQAGVAATGMGMGDGAGCGNLAWGPPPGVVGGGACREACG